VLVSWVNEIRQLARLRKTLPRLFPLAAGGGQWEKAGEAGPGSLANESASPT
jgi:hypothetical protein